MNVITYNPFVYPFIKGTVLDGEVTHPFNRTLVQPAQWDRYDDGEDMVTLAGTDGVYLVYAEETTQYNYTNMQWAYYDFDFEVALPYLNQSSNAHITWQILNSNYNLTIDRGLYSDQGTYMNMNLEWNSTLGCYVALNCNTLSMSMVVQKGTETRVLTQGIIQAARANGEWNYIAFDDTTYIKGIYRLYSGYNWSNLDDFGDSYYQQGVTDGIREASVELSPFEYMRQAGTAIADIFGMQIFPGVTLGTIMAVPVIGALIIVMVKILRR